MEADLDHPTLAVTPVGGRRGAACPEVLRDHAPGVGSTADPGTPVAEVATAALEWLRHLADGDRLAVLDDDALLADLRVLEEVGRLVDAGRMFAAGVVAQRSRTATGQDLCTREGFTKPEDMIAQVTGTSTRQVRERIRRAEPLQHTTPPTPGSRNGEETGIQHDGDGPGAGGVVTPFPLLRLALRAGLISPETTDVVTTALTPTVELGVPPARVRQAECVLLVAALGADVITAHESVFGQLAPDVLREARRSHTQARGVPLTQLTRLARSWNRVLTLEASSVSGQVDAREVRGRQEARRFLTIHPPRDGTRRIEGELLPDAAAQLERLLDAYLNPRTGTASPAGTATGSGTSEGSGVGTDSRQLPGGGTRPDPRSPRQKRHDALAGILTQAAGMPTMPLMGGAAPTLVVTTTLDQLDHPGGIAFLQGSHHEANSDVDVSVAQHTGCVGAVQRIVLGPQGRVVELGAPQRIFTTHQRRAIATRDGGCIIPGCEVPATWCEIHHVHEWRHGGPTHTDNGVTLCWHHHRNLDQLGWDIRMRDGTPWVRPPTSVDPHRRWHPAQTSLHLSFDQDALRHPGTAEGPPGDTDGATDTGSGNAAPDVPRDNNGTGPPAGNLVGPPGDRGTGAPAADPGPASATERRSAHGLGRRPASVANGRSAPTSSGSPVQRLRMTGPPATGDPSQRWGNGTPEEADDSELHAPPLIEGQLFALSG